MRTKLHQRTPILLIGMVVGLLVQFTLSNVHAQAPSDAKVEEVKKPKLPKKSKSQELRKFFGAVKVSVKLDPFSNIPEADIPFDRYFYIRKYIPLANPDPLIAFMFEVDKDGEAVFKQDARGITATVKAEVFKVPEESGKEEVKGYKSFNILVSPLKPVNPLKPHTNYKLSLFVPMSDARLINFAQAFIHIHRNESAQAKIIVDSIEKQKRDVSDTRLVSMAEMESYYNTHLKKLIADLPLTTVAEGNAAKAKIVAALKDQKQILLPDLLPTSKQFIFVFHDEVPEPNSVTTEPAKLETRAGTYVQPDFGAVYYGFFGGSKGYDITPTFRGVTPYIGVSILARPFDADIPLRDVFQHQKLKFYHRLSLQLGLTLTSLAKDRYRANSFGSFNPMIGVGVRLTSTFKVHAGSVLYRQLDSNPLLDRPRTRGIGYLGISLDLRIREVLKDVGKLLTPGTK